MNKINYYTKLAQYYDLSYDWKDYSKESKKIHQLIQKYKQTKGNQLLDVACGTGNHIKYLKRDYNITGYDLNKEMLAIAKQKFSDIRFIQGDMTSFNFKKKFDVVTCLFSSIAYTKTYRNLEKTLSCFYNHLKSGGVTIIEPFLSPQIYQQGYQRIKCVDKPGIRLARIDISKKRGNTAILDINFLVSTKKKVEHIKDIHKLGLFDTDKFLSIMKNQGFQAKYLKRGLMKGRGLYIGVKK
jgi:ubiquinone/menaquinone biosynthesis C-methylase UbiE